MKLERQQIILRKKKKKEITIEDTKQRSHEQLSNQNSKPTHTDIRKEFDDALTLLKSSYHEHKIEDAYDQLIILRGIKKSDGLQHDFKIHIESVFKENQEFFEQIDEDLKDINHLVHQLQDEEGWNLEKVKKSFTVKYKKNANDTVAIRMEGTIDVPVFNVLCLMYEAEGHPLWIPFCSKANELKKIHRSCKAIYQKFGFPLPLSDREAYLWGYGVDRFDRNGSVLIITKSYHNDKRIQQKYGLEVPDKSKCVRMDIEFMGSEIIPMGKDKIRFKAVVKMNPHVKLIPLSFLNFLTRKAASLVFEKLSKKAKSLKGSQWDEKIQNNKEFYSWLEGNIEKFLKEHGLYK